MDLVTTSPRSLHCTECGEGIPVIGTYTGSLIRHMVNAGEISVGEARDEAHNGLHDRDTEAFLAGWVLDRADQGDHWRAGDPERLYCGCVISYDRTQVDTRCGTRACVLSTALLEV